MGELFRANKEFEYNSYNMKMDQKRFQETGYTERNFANTRPSFNPDTPSHDVEPQRKPETKRRRGEFNQ